MKQKPNLFIVGQPKSGTTALSYFLSQHPDVFMSKPKEPCFFCYDIHKISNSFHGKKTKRYFEFQDLGEYLELYKNSNSKIKGEASTNYLYSKVAAKEIFKFNPDAKIIIILREPVSFVYSLYNQYKNATEENADSFEEALRLEPIRKRGESLPKRTRCPDYLFYSERIKYDEQIKRYFGLFPKENIKVIIFDDFRENNARIYRNVLEFLGVDASFKPNFKGIHESKVPKNKFLNKLFRTPLIKSVFKKILPMRIYYSLQLEIQRLLMKEQKREEIDPKLRKELMRKFKSEVIKLNFLLHKENCLSEKRDLVKEWGYNKI